MHSLKMEVPDASIMAYQVGQYVSRILDGEASAAEVGLLKMPVITRFDKRAMDQCGIMRSSLPGDTEYLNDPVRDAVLQYKRVLFGGVGTIVLLIALVALLLRDNRRRRVLIRKVQERERQLQNVMVCALTQGKKKYAEHAELTAEVGEKAQMLKAQYVDVIDRDTEAFNAVSAVFAMGKLSPA